MGISQFVIGVLIGIVFGVPVGAVGALTVRRTMEYGAIAGLVSGLGCSAADALYACISVFGFSFVAPFLTEYRVVIGLVGGVVLVALGIGIVRQRPAPAHARRTGASLPAFFGSLFAIALSSPSTVLMFLLAFTVFGVGESVGLLDGVLLVVGIALGTCCWWVLLARVVGSFRSKVTHASMRVFNRACGVFVAAFGLIAALRPLVQ